MVLSTCQADADKDGINGSLQNIPGESGGVPD